MATTGSAVLSANVLIVGKPTALTLLQSHVLDWKRHYGLESQAVLTMEHEYVNSCSQVDGLSFLEKKVRLAKQGQEIVDLTVLYQLKRDLIQKRHQQELFTQQNNPLPI